MSGHSLAELVYVSDTAAEEIAALFARGARLRAEAAALAERHAQVAAEVERLRAEERARLLARAAEGVRRG